MLNEPSAGLFFNYSFQSMLFSPENERDFVKFHLGPMAQNSSYKDVKIIMLDDQRLFLPFWAQKVSQFVGNILNCIEHSAHCSTVNTVCVSISEICF